jgi:DNA polymerase-3 subunit gamma/tau
MTLLYEKYRPQTFADVIGQDRAVSTIDRIIGREGWGGQAWWLSGPSGTGKTTLGRIIGAVGADTTWND